MLTFPFGTRTFWREGGSMGQKVVKALLVISSPLVPETNTVWENELGKMAHFKHYKQPDSPKKTPHAFYHSSPARVQSRGQ